MKAQTSVEGMITMIIVLVVFGISITATLTTQDTTNKMQIFFEKRKTCTDFSNEVNNVFLQGHGTKSTIFLKYKIAVQQNYAIVDNVFCSLCCNVTKNGQPNFNLTGYVTIENKNGDIVA